MRPGRHEKANREAMPPEKLAGLVFDSIRNDQLYLLSHPEFNDGIKQRSDNIIKHRNPMAPGF